MISNGIENEINVGIWWTNVSHSFASIEKASYFIKRINTISVIADNLGHYSAAAERRSYALSSVSDKQLTWH
jgi:hypothetical protein